MSVPEKDVVRLRHIVEAADQALTFCRDHTRSDLDTNPMLRFALVHALMIVGEAASKVSEPTRNLLPDVAWPAIVGMRNRLVHAYFEVDSDVLWQSVNDELPSLAQRLKTALAAG